MEARHRGGLGAGPGGVGWVGYRLWVSQPLAGPSRAPNAKVPLPGALCHLAEPQAVMWGRGSQDLSRGHLAQGCCARVRRSRGQAWREAPSGQRGGPGRFLSPAVGPGPQAPSPKPGQAGATGPWHRSPGTHCPSTVEGARAACPPRNHGDWGVGPGLLVGLGLWEVLGETWSAFQGARAPPG